MVYDHSGSRAGEKTKGEEQRNSGVVEKIFDCGKLF